MRIVRTIKYNNLLFYLLFIILYNILYNVNNLLFIRLAVITHNWIIRHSVTIISCGAFVPLAVKWPLDTRNFSRITVKALVTSNIIQSVCLVGKGQLKERCGLEPRTDCFFRLRNRQKLVRVTFECGLDSRMYSIYYIHVMLCTGYVYPVIKLIRMVLCLFTFMFA